MPRKLSVASTMIAQPTSTVLSGAANQIRTAMAHPNSCSSPCNPWHMRPFSIASAKHAVPQPHRHAEVELGKVVMDAVRDPQRAQPRVPQGPMVKAVVDQAIPDGARQPTCQAGGNAWKAQYDRAEIPEPEHRGGGQE